MGGWTGASVRYPSVTLPFSDEPIVGPRGYDWSESKPVRSPHAINGTTTLFDPLKCQLLQSARGAKKVQHHAN